LRFAEHNFAIDAALQRRNESIPAKPLSWTAAHLWGSFQIDLQQVSGIEELNVSNTETHNLGQMK
jgi:hypothetical protein